MGNRAKRKEAARLIKEYGGLESRLYNGRARNARKILNAATLDSIIYLLQFKPGMLACDYGHNHRIKGWAYKNFHHRLNDYRFKIRRGYVFNVPQFEYEDGYISCGCGACPDPAMTREQLESFWLNVSDEYIEHQRAFGWWGERDDAIRNHIMNGGHIHDEDGILLPEWRK